MTNDEAQRFLALMAEEGKSEIEAYRLLMRVLGIACPVFGCAQDEGGLSDKEFGYVLAMQRELLETLIELGMSDEARAEAEAHLNIIHSALEG